MKSAISKACRSLGAPELLIARLPVSPNYYDDLDARLGLEEAFLDQLKHHGILYGRDEEGGEYFQLYSPFYGEGFFFEIIERRGGYTGYGAAAAQVT